MAAMVWCLCCGGVAEADEPPGVSSKFRSVVVEGGKTVGEIVCMGCSVEVRGVVTGDVLTFGGNITVRGGVKGDIVAIGGCVQLMEKSVVEGDAAAIGGYVESVPGVKPAGDSDSFPFIHLPGQRSFHFAGLFTYLAANVLGVLLAVLIVRRRRVANIAAALKSHVWQALGLGIAGLLIWQLIVIVSGRTHGWVALLVSLEILILAAICLPGYAGASNALGTVCFRNRGWIFPLLAGTVAISAIQLIPVAGFFLMLTTLALSLGSVILSGIGGNPTWFGSLFRRSNRS